MKLALNGGPPTALAVAQGVTGGIAVDADSVYWSSVGQKAIRSLSLASGGGTSDLATNQSTVLSLRVRDRTLYWADDEVGDVFSMPAAGGTPTPLITGQGVNYIAVDDRHVYWTDPVGNKVVRVPRAGGPPTVVAANQPAPSDIAADDRSIYWLNAVPNGAVLRLAK
jgi:hypothetical protein